jgi:phage N-6-adenine-methyltransferase
MKPLQGSFDLDMPVGDNAATVRLGLLADAAHKGLYLVVKGEGYTIAGWLAYGAALNEGRELFPSDEQFGQWVAEMVSDNLSVTPNDHERAAAMWAAANPEQFEQAKSAGNARTVRGIHAKWKEIDAERVAAEARAEAEKAKKEADEAAAAEAEARRKEQEATDEEARKAAAAAAAEATRAAARATKEAGKAEKTAKKAEKKADKIKAGNNSADHVRGTLGTGENEWYTPQEYVESARFVLGAIDLDPASTEQANETVKARTFFAEADNGLEKDWFGNIWLNPPYAQPTIAQFADKVVAEWESGRITSAIVLTHNYTDTAWFQKVMNSATAICFTRGRVRFYSPAGEIAAPTQGQAFFYFGDDLNRFVEAFSGIGTVVPTLSTFNDYRSV